MPYLAYGIVPIMEGGMLVFRAQLVPLVLAPPLLHLPLSYFTSHEHLPHILGAAVVWELLLCISLLYLMFYQV